MAFLHDRIVGLFSLAMELFILHDDFYTSYIALDTIKKIAPILSNSIEVVRIPSSEKFNIRFRVLNFGIKTS